jgi:hypothetical protein
MSTPQRPNCSSQNQNQNQASQQSPQQQYYPPQSHGGSAYDLPPALGPASSEKPKRNTLIRIICILFAVYQIIPIAGCGLLGLVDPMYAFLSICSLFACVTLFILGIHKRFAKEGGQFKAIGLLLGNFAALYDVEIQTTEWIVFNIVKSFIFLMIYLGVSFQKQVKFFRYFAPLQWNYGPAK